MAWRGWPGGPCTASTWSSHVATAHDWVVGVPGGRGIKVAHTALSLYRIVPVGYRVQIHEEEYRTPWGQALSSALP